MSEPQSPPGTERPALAATPAHGPLGTGAVIATRASGAVDDAAAHPARPPADRAPLAASLTPPGTSPTPASSSPTPASTSPAPPGTSPTPSPAAAGRLPLEPRTAHALAFTCGLLYFLAFPGIDLWPLAFVALVPLAVALRGQSPRHAAAIGWTAGFTMTMFGFYWLLEMLQTFSGFPVAVCFVFMAILCAYQAGRVGLMGWLHGRMASRGWPAGPAFALAFVASELVFPLLFPWYFGATVHQVPALTQVAELGGPIMVGLVLLAVNLALAEPLLARLEVRKVRLPLLAGLVGVAGAAAAYGAVRIPQTDAVVRQAEKAQIGVVQANMSLLAKRQDRQEGLRRHLILTRQLQAQGPLDLVVWSETSVAGAVPESLAARLYPRHFTRELGVPAIFGAILTRRVDDARGHAYFNAALVSDGSGAIRGRYDKQFLLAFGEYLPFGSLFPILYDWSPNTGKFTPGTTLEALPVGTHRVSTHICYEDVSPSFVNGMMRASPADLLVNITNDAWFGDSTEPWIHLALAKFRAIEHRRFFVRSTNSGVSAIIDPVGRVVAHTGTFREESARAEVAWLRATTPYELYADAPWWLMTFAAALAAFYRRPSRRISRGA